MIHFVLRFARNAVGATAIEYALIAASISIVIVTAAQLLGDLPPSNRSKPYHVLSGSMKRRRRDADEETYDGANYPQAA